MGQTFYLIRQSVFQLHDLLLQCAKILLFLFLLKQDDTQFLKFDEIVFVTFTLHLLNLSNCIRK